MLLVVDQLGADEFERVGFLFQHGFSYLLEHGVSFSQAHHAHAITETGPGHATLATGQFPRRHGIIGNWWLEGGDPEKGWAIDDEEFDESPRRLLSSTLGDWLKQGNAGSKVFAASGKDRAAILMAGRRGDGAFWLAEESGGMGTSGYYGEPTWLREFLDQGSIDAYSGRLWEPLPLNEEQLDRLQIHTLDLGPLRPGFPHATGPPRPAGDEDAYYALRDSPWLDSYVADLARFVIDAESLGQDEHPDLLALSFSAADYVGHDFGPHSREYVDVLLRLDRTIGELLDHIDRRVGLERTLIALSSDHGVVPVPEVLRDRGLPGRRVDHEVVLCVQQVGRRLASAHGVDRWLLPGPLLVADLPGKTGLSREELERKTAAELERCPGVARVWTRSELLQEVDEADGERWLFVNGFHLDRSPDFQIRFEEYFMPSVSNLTTHGSSYAYDTRVPMVIVAPGLEAARKETPIRTADLAPTLAALAGIAYPAELDGRNLAALVQPSERLRQ